MPLATRVIASLLYNGFSLTKGRGFASDRPIGDALKAVNVFAERGVDELVFLDISATRDDAEPDYDLVAELTADFFQPLAVGGGIRSVEHVRRLLRSGADKIILGTAAYECPALIGDLACKFGCQVATVAVDVKDGRVWVRSGTKPTGLDPVSYARRVADLGAGEILLQSIDRDGTLSGYDLDTIDAISAAVPIPVIASGGCGSAADMEAAILAGADAVAAGAAFQFTALTPREAKEYLAERGHIVRL